MSMVQSLWASVQGDPVFMRKANGWLTIVWFIAAFPICIFLAESIQFLVFVSVYAVVTGHLSTWQAARVEVKQEQDADVGDVLHAVKKQTELDPGIDADPDEVDPNVDTTGGNVRLDE